MSIMTSPALRYSKSLWSYNPLPNGCILYLPLWSPGLDGTTIKSTDPFGLKLVTPTSPPPTLGTVGRIFTGNDDYRHPTFLDVMPASDTLTLACWAYFDAQGSAEMLLVKHNINGQDRIELSKPAGNNLTFFTEGGNGGNKAITSVGELSAATWYFCAGVYEAGAAIKVYLGAATASTATVASGVNADTILDGTFEDFSIGSRVGGTWLTGRMGDVWVYDRAPTQAEIDYLMNQTKGRYL